MSLRLLRVVVLASLAGCYSVDVPSGKLACGPSDQCPASYHCAADGRCWKNGENPGPLDGGPGVSDLGTGCDGSSCVSCTAGTHACASGCVDDHSVQSCGASCTACPVPAFGAASCDGTTCGVTCDTGHHLCGTLCASDSDTTTCGSSCSACSSPAHSTATCDGTRCGFTCDPGYHNCGNQCVLSNDTATCGTSCTPCAIPISGIATCDGTQCGITCGGGFHACGSKCLDNTATASCGVSCTPCAPPTGGSATCNGVACGGTCPMGFKLCVGACISSTSSCNGVCPSGTHDCSGLCASNTDVNSCGGACAPCPVPANAQMATCNGTACAFTCSNGYGDCNGVAVDGCEANLNSDPNNCMTCNHACSVTDPNALPTCLAGACVSTCKPGFHSCGSGCVSNSSLSTCGSSCSTPCATPPNASATCNGTVCGFTCAAGFADCNGLAGDGCEIDKTTDVNNCGACSMKCSTSDPNAAPVCANSTCQKQCTSGFHDCGGPACAANSATASCGASCTACPLRPNASATCDGTNCGYLCLPGYGDCDGVASNGCEVNLQTDPSHCGACTAPCSLPNAVPSCSAGFCKIASCSANHGDCDGIASNGCEVNLQTDPSHCGNCTTVCPAVANGTRACANSTCGIASCNPGYGDCNMALADGCEANLTMDGNNCGVCNNRCTTTDPNATPNCSSSACGTICNAGYHNCGGLCSSNTSVNSCGSSCGSCGTRPNSMTGCNGTQCTFTCNPGFADCNNLPADGCEVAIASDPSNCGTCGHVCPSAMNAAPTCASSTCGISCNPGFGNCDGVAANGCEVNLQSDVNNCGVCNMACPLDPNGMATCVASTCGQNCFVNFHPCAGACASNSSVNSCGTSSCTPCMPPANASATCSGTACGYTCNSSYVDDGMGGCTPAPPRLVAPLSSAFTTQQQPTFKVALAGGTNGATVVVCTTRNCKNAANQSTIAAQFSLAITSPGFAAAKPTSALAAGTYFWHAFGKIGAQVGTKWSTIWEVVIPHANGGTVDSSYGSLADFNADGSPDLAAAGNRSLYVYNNNGGTWPTSYSLAVTQQGAPLAMAGDVNGDGYPDLITGGFQYACGSFLCAQAPQILTGTPSGLSSSTTYSLTISWAATFAGVGDVNGDGYGDVATLEQAGANMYLDIFLGGPNGPSPTPSAQFGVTIQGDQVPDSCERAISSVGGGDLNGDGYGDVVVAGWGAHNCAPVISNARNGSLFLGGANSITSATPAITLAPPAGGDSGYAGFGTSVTAAGDINGDGYCDIVAGAEDNAASTTSGAFVYFGAATLTSPVAISQKLSGPSSSQFGVTIALGDFTADGVSDLVVGAPGSRSVYVYHGQTGAGLFVAANETLTSAANNNWGYSVANAGDVNLDGILDIAVGMNDTSSGSTGGKVFLYPGQLGSVNTAPAQIINSAVIGFGAGIARLGPPRFWPGIRIRR